jgi:hypothetical protein
MSGFLKLAIKAEHYGQSIVNTFAYRSSDWPWIGQGNPFADVDEFLTEFWAAVDTQWLAVHNANYRVLQLEAVALTDSFAIATPQPVIKTVNLPGTRNASNELDTTGSSVCATLGFILGQQVQIIGTAKSPRNRGYISLGPIPELYADSYGHIVGGLDTMIEAVAQAVVAEIVSVPLTATFTPIRFHGKRVNDLFGPGHHWEYLTYTDIVGYRLPRKVSWRRSRMPEA